MMISRLIPLVNTFMVDYLMFSSDHLNFCDAEEQTISSLERNEQCCWFSLTTDWWMWPTTKIIYYVMKDQCIGTEKKWNGMIFFRKAAVVSSLEGSSNSVIHVTLVAEKLWSRRRVLCWKFYHVINTLKHCDCLTNEIELYDMWLRKDNKIYHLRLTLNQEKCWVLPISCWFTWNRFDHSFYVSQLN